MLRYVVEARDRDMNVVQRSVVDGAGAANAVACVFMRSATVRSVLFTVQGSAPEAGA